jgi:hypothetical protein
MELLEIFFLILRGVGPSKFKNVFQRLNSFRYGLWLPVNVAATANFYNRGKPHKNNLAIAVVAQKN